MAKFEEVRYIYNIPSIGIYESTYLIEGIELASIKNLEKELLDQGTLLRFIPNTCELHEDSPLQDYAGRGNDLYYIVCKEGIYSFDTDAYHFVGEFKREHIKRSKYVSIPNDIFVRNSEELIIVKAGQYEILHCEEMEINNSKKHEVFEIEMETKELDPGEYPFTKVKLPNYPCIFLIFECDFLDVESLEIIECEIAVQ